MVGMLRLRTEDRYAFLDATLSMTFSTKFVKAILYPSA